MAPPSPDRQNEPGADDIPPDFILLLTPDYTVAGGEPDGVINIEGKAMA